MTAHGNGVSVKDDYNTLQLDHAGGYRTEYTFKTPLNSTFGLKFTECRIYVNKAIFLKK